MALSKENIEDIIQLSPMQESIYFECLLHPDGNAYHEHTYYYLDGQLDVHFLNLALNNLIASHPALRTVFRKKMGHGLLQIILKQRPVTITSLAFDHEGWESEFEKVKEADRALKYNLASDELLRLYVIQLPDHKSILFLSHHHIVMDGWSMALFIRQLADQYKAAVRGTTLVKTAASSFSEYIKWIGHQAKEVSMNYWLEYLANYQSAHGLHTFSTPETDQKPYCLQKATVTLSKEESQHLRSRTAGWQVTANTYFQTIWGVLLAKYYQTDDVVFGAVVTDRPAEIKGVDDILGLFINTIPVRLTFDAQEQLIALLKKTQLAAAEAKVHQYLPTAKIQSQSAVKNKLIDHIIVFENYATQDAPEEENEAQWPVISQIGVDEQTGYDLNIMIVPGEQYEVRLEYNANHLDHHFIEQMLGHYHRLLADCLDREALTIDEISSLVNSGNPQLMKEGSDLQIDYPDKTIPALFQESVQRFPDKVAMLCGEASISYQDLDSYASQIAAMLMEKGVAPGTLVGLYMDRSIDTVAGMLGILKAGGGYVPIDVDYPQERVDYLIENSQVPYILTAKTWKEDLPEGCQVVTVEEAKEADLPYEAPVFNPEQLCYVIYTSGTTGHPKGVKVNHRNVVRLLFNEAFQFDFGADDVWTMFHSHCFDFSVWEIYGALLRGGQLVIVPKSEARDPQRFADILETHQVTVLNQTPSAFYNLTTFLTAGRKRNLSLRYVIFGGEALSPGRLKDWHTIYDQVTLINMFGITETTVHVTYKEITSKEITADLSNIGKPIPTTSVYVLNEQLQWVPTGVIGEMYVGGMGVTDGYLHNEKLTAEKFIDDPFVPGARMYKTGDLARVLPSGDLEYHGRIDNQVQLRGFRIELSEIENTLQSLPEVDKAIVLLRKDHDSPQIFAWYQAAQVLDSGSLLGFLKSKLPAYMMPSRIIYVEDLPLTANGKLDTSALPVEVTRSVKEDRVMTLTEGELMTFWKELLSLEHLSVHDNFFDVGGDSIKVIDLLMKVNHRFGNEIKLASLYSNPTISRQAALIDGTQENKVLDNDSSIIEVDF